MSVFKKSADTGVVIFSENKMEIYSTAFKCERGKFQFLEWSKVASDKAVKVKSSKSKNSNIKNIKGVIALTFIFKKYPI